MARTRGAWEHWTEDLAAALLESGFNVVEAAELYGCAPSTIYRRARQLREWHLDELERDLHLFAITAMLNALLE